MNLDKTLEALETSVMHMGSKVVAQHESCLDILQSKDKERALKIVKADDFINRYEEDINNQAIEQFALLSPVASDLRRVIVAIKIASELERIGDYAKTLAEFVIKGRDPEEEKLLDHAISMEEHTISMLKDALEAYKNKDLDAAFSIPKQDEEIDAMLKAFRDKLQAEEEKVTLKQAFYLSMLFKNMERTGDHTINICEHIVYLCKGIQYDFG